MNSSIKEIIKIDLATFHQRVEGFGTSLAWWAHMVGGWTMLSKSGREVREEIAQLVFDPDKGLGFNILRYYIGGGDDESHDHIKRIEAMIPSYKKTETSSYDWTADQNQVWVMEKAIQYQKDNAIIEAFSVSSPYWMTVSGCSSGNEDPSMDNLKTEYYRAFATYLVDVVNYLRTGLGISVDYLEPINEAASSYWISQSPKQEGAHFDPGSSQSRIYREVAAELRQKGVLETRLTGTDETSIDQAIESFLLLDNDVKELLAKINTHSYGGTRRAELARLAEVYDKNLWMSEVCVGEGAYDRDSMLSAVSLGKVLLKDFREMRVTGWVIWQAVESMIECLKYKDTNSNWGLIHGVYEEEAPYQVGDYFVTKQYYAMAHFSKFIRPGYTIVESDHAMSLAAISKDLSTLVIVVINDGDESKVYDLSLVNEKREIADMQVFRTDQKGCFVQSSVDIHGKDRLEFEMSCQAFMTIIITF